MVALADINATLQDQNQTLDSVNKNLVAMLRADLDAAKRETRESGRRREREREASQKNRVATSQLGAGAAFKRGLVGDGLGGAIDKLMAGALGGLAGLIPLAMAGAGRGIRFGAAALVANAFIEDALNYAFDNFPGFEGLDNLQRKEFLDKATTGMNAAFIARFMGAKMPATIAAALGAAYAKEIGQFIGGTVDENGNLTIKNPVDGLLTSLGYEDILPKDFKLGPLELQAVGAVGAVIMTSVISNIFKLMRFIPAGRMLTLLGTLGLAGFDDLVKLIKDSKAAALPPRVVTDPRTNLPRQSNAFKPYGSIKGAPTGFVGEKMPAPIKGPVTPYAGFGTSRQQLGIGERIAAPEGTRKINPIFESNRPLTGQSLRSVAQSGGPAPYAPTNQYPLPPSMDQALQGSRAYNNLKLLAKALIKIAGPALTAYLVFEICRIVLGVGPYKGTSEKEKTAMIGQLLGGFLQGTLLVMLAAALGGVGVTAITGGAGAGWGTLLGAIAGGGIAYFTPNFMGEVIAAWLLGQSSVEYERKVTQLQAGEFANTAFNLTGTSVLAGEDAGKKAAMIMGMGGGAGLLPFLNIQGGGIPNPNALSTNPNVAAHQAKKLAYIAARDLERIVRAYNIDGEGSFGAPVGNTVIINQADNSDKSVKASNTQVGNGTRAAAIDYSTLSMYGEARLFGSGAMWANGQLNTPLY